MWARAVSPLTDLEADAAAYDAAVVDIGSNSVRLVMYRIEGRAIWTVFNEKVLAGLGRDMGKGGKLSAPGVEQAVAALRRFQALLDAASVETVFVVATAAVREAKDGAAFVARVERETGLKVRVLTGPEEARYSALGVAAGLPQADGVVGDLGGSSLELVRIRPGGEPVAGVSLPWARWRWARRTRSSRTRCTGASTSCSPTPTPTGRPSSTPSAGLGGILPCCT
jgi:exopolyphosphatase/guanosine-5'-triphosphate,3'-diphosphate pyrophosphatase